LLIGCSNTPVSTGPTPEPSAPAQSGGGGDTAASSGGGGVFNGSPDQKYFMNVFLIGAEFWKGCYDGFVAAAEQLGVSTEITGSMDYDAIQQVEAFEQILAQDPAGILVCPIDEDSLTISVQRALDMGVPVVTFYTDAPGTDRLAIYGTSPENEGRIAAYWIADQLNGAGDIAIITRPQENVMRRIVEFERIMAEEFPNINIVQSIYAEADTTKAAEMTSGILQANPNIQAMVPFAALEAIGVAQAKRETGMDFRVITFEADPGVLDLIEQGLIDATVGQDTFSSGYYPMIDLYIAKNRLCQPFTDWQKNPWSPLPWYIEFDNPVITKENVSLFEQPTW